MRTDALVANENELGDVVGNFYGTDIRELNTLAVAVREELDAQTRIRAGLGIDSAPIELLPGEVIKNNIIRRETTAEVIGEQFYAAEIPAGKRVPLHEGLTDVGLVTWRPNNQDFAVIHEEVAE